MPIKLTAEQFAEKHARRLKGSTEDIRQGVQRVTVAPTLQAVAKKDKMIQNLTEAVQSGKWERGLKRVSLDEWKEKTLTKGIGRIAAGIDSAHDKMVDFGGQLLDYESGLQKEVETMPDLTLEDSISRMTTWVRGMAKFTRK